MNFRRGSLRRSAKGVIGHAQDSDLNIPRRTEVRPCEWPHNAFMNEARFHQEFVQFIANAGLIDFIAHECDQHQILTNMFVQRFTFLPRNNPREVSFDLYAENHQIPLTEFCDICMIPPDGSLAEPRLASLMTFTIL